MSKFEALKSSLPEFARDIRVNLGNLFGENGAALERKQIALIALACSYQLQNVQITQALREEFSPLLSPEDITGAKASATIMAMNNIYYRFLHLAEEPALRALPAGLRMQVIGKPGIPKIDFELACLAVSSLAGCGNCIGSHTEELKKAGVSLEGIQLAVKIAAVLNAFDQALKITE